MVQSTVITSSSADQLDRKLEAFLHENSSYRIISLEAWSLENELGDLTYGVDVFWQVSSLPNRSSHSRTGCEYRESNPRDTLEADETMCYSLRD